MVRTAASREVYVGRYFGERQVDVTADLVSHYSESVADHYAWYSGESPFSRPVAPALVLHSEVYRYQGWYLPNVYGNLHAKQEWELFWPIAVGERVTTRSTIVDRYVKRDREYVVNEVACFGSDGRLLNRGRTHQSFLMDGGAGGLAVDKEREKRPDRRFESGQGPALEELPALVKDVTLDMCQKFSGPAKNYHTDREAARALGFPDIVVQGMMSLCFLSEMMTERFGVGWYVGGRMSVNLVNVLWLGERLTCRGVVRELAPAGVGRRAKVEVWCQKEDGTKTVVGTASAVID
ncbi:MAG TPA: hypothetical protein VFT91_08375 [Dehalococcoidia bacterium]|nr:hypothetical protein [Dehalococcoidia bacterium]